MSIPKIEKLAKLCVKYSVDLKPKEKVFIQGSVLAFPLLKELYKECLLREAYPTLMPNLHFEYTFYRFAKEHQLNFVSPFEKFRAENMDVSISVICEPNPRKLTNLDPEKKMMHRSSKKEIMEIAFRRMAEGKLRWASLPFPIKAQAQEAAMSIEEYEDFVYSSCLVDKKDPVEEWKKIRKKQEKICKFLNKATEIHIEGEDTDLTLNVKGRKWINGSGNLNLPDGELFTGPLENSANGSIRFTYPGIVSGQEIEDIKLSFKDGKIVEAKASKGDELFQELIKIQGADHIGEVAIGTNYGITKFSKNMLFDEKMGGTMHIALGASIPESKGLNKSAIHFDILKDMKKNGKIFAKNKLFYKNGNFLI
jgi:aminopeptidase